MFNRLTTDKPTIVIAHRIAEYEQYCMNNDLDQTNSIMVTSPHALENYPIDCPLVKTGNHWLTPAHDSPQLKEREEYWENVELRKKENAPKIIEIYEKALRTINNEVSDAALLEVKELLKQ